MAEDVERFTRAARGRTPVRSEKVSSVIARTIVNDIVSRRMPPGMRLPSESRMLEEFDVGRTSLREALRILEVHGLLSIKSGPGGGPTVGSVRSEDFGRMMTLYLHMSQATFGELMQARLVMEPTMARLAASAQNPDLIQSLLAVVDASTTALPDDDMGWMAASTQFHSLVAGMSGNRVLDLIGRALRDIYADRTRGLSVPAESRDEVLQMHREICDAIARGDGDRAATLMREHIDDVWSIIRKNFPGMEDELVFWK
jgi:GntR family transcriptional regulator, transcriptional repressor for pyruvate dehydrogenase complex